MIFAASFVLQTIHGQDSINELSRKAQKAEQLVREGKPQDAIPIYLQLIRASPNRPEFFVDLCVAEFKAKQYRRAIEHASVALRLNPDLAVANLFLGASYLEMRRYTSAIAPLEKALAATPADRNARLMLAEALSGAARYDDALKQFRSAAEALAGSPRVWYGMGQVYDALAGQICSDIQKRFPDSASSEPAASYAQCNAYRRLADESYARLAQLAPSFESHLHAAKILDAAGRHREAVSEWKSGLQLDPQNAQAQLGLAWSLYQLRDYDAALPVLAHLLEIQPDSGDVTFLYGATLLNVEKPDAAIPYLQTALKRNPQMRAAQAALGQALLRCGEPEQAIPYLQAALVEDRDGDTHFQLFRAFQLTGKADLAKRALADYQKYRISLSQKDQNEQPAPIAAPSR
jgi:protein O-GlcNAc transferase